MTKIKDIKTTVYQWKGKTVPPQKNFCTNASDLLYDQMQWGHLDFMNGWFVKLKLMTVLLELVMQPWPSVAKKTMIYLKPLLINEDPFDYAYLWEKMYRRTLAWGRKGVGMTAISAVDIAIWDLIGKITKKPVFKLLGGRTKEKIPVYASKLYSQPIKDLQQEARYQISRFYYV